MNSNSNKKSYLIALLIMLSIVATTGTFAYWASFVEGTQESAVSTLTVGNAQSVETQFAISNNFDSGGLLVPNEQLLNSGFNAVSEIVLSYDLAWEEANLPSQVEGTESTAPVSINHSLIIEKDGQVLDSTLFPNIYDLIQVVYNNSDQLLILNGDAKTFAFTVSLSEPLDQEEYDLISEASITIVFNFRIFDNFVETIDMSLQDSVEGPYMEFVGDQVLTIELASEFVDPGIIAYNSLGEEISNTWYQTDLNTWEVGTYTITYGAYSSYDNESVTPITRTIYVVDTTAPVIHLNGPEIFYVQLGTTYTDWGAWASDESSDLLVIQFDGESEVDTSTPGTYYVTFTTVDYSGNEAIKIRTVIVE
jgi:hypothetical protein